MKVKSDNVIALTLLTKMRTKKDSPELAIVARELALHLVDLSFPPDAEHTPGLGHIFADKLSRVYAPTGNGALTPDLHPAMAYAQESIAPVRGTSYYKIPTKPRARRGQKAIGKALKRPMPRRDAAAPT